MTAIRMIKLVSALVFCAAMADEVGFIAPARGFSGGSDLSSRIRAYMGTEATTGRFSGVVLLTKHGKTVFNGAVGQASLEYTAPNTVSTAFNIGSIDKLFTQIAIQQLISEKRLRENATIGELLPDYPNVHARSVTVAQLLDMSSGIGDIFGPKYFAMPKDRLRKLADYVPLFADKPLAFSPGTGHAYSNGGYIVLGLIIEHVTGQSYYDYIHDHVFVPAGMVHSSWPERDNTMAGLATGYTNATDSGRSTGERRNNMYTVPARGSSAGGGYATAADLERLAQALISRRLDIGRPIGPGLAIGGGAPGINAFLQIDTKSGYVLVVLSNYDPPAAEDVAKTIGVWLGLHG
jgi:CubicO group peptidase (beta-lactamase class C family)